jgi:hypothetical protein
MGNTNFVYLECGNCGLRTKDCTTSGEALKLFNKRTGLRKMTHDELEEHYEPVRKIAIWEQNKEVEQ